MGAAAGETRATGSVGLHATPYRRLRVGFVLHPGVSYRVKRVANRRGAGPRRRLPSTTFGSPASFQRERLRQVSPRLILVGQQTSFGIPRAATRSSLPQGSSVRHFRREDCHRAPCGHRVLLAGRGPEVSLQFRGGVHSQAPGRLAFTGASAAELSRFRNEARVLIGDAGVSIVTSRGLRARCRRSIRWRAGGGDRRRERQVLSGRLLFDGADRTLARQDRFGPRWEGRRRDDSRGGSRAVSIGEMSGL